MNILEARRRVLGGEVYKKTAEGNPVSVRSLARMRPGLSIMGKSTQKTTTGAQLLDLQDSETSSSGISYIVKDGAITATGTATDTAVAAEKKISLQNGTYYVSGKNGNLIFWIKILYSDDKPVAFFNNTSFNVDDTAAEIIAYAQVDKGKTVNNAVMYPMLNAGSSALPWEPYTGGKPSPSPDYPQEITSAGDDGSIQVDITGANICPETQRVNVNIAESGNMSHYGYSGLIPVVPGEKYYPNASMIVRYFDESKELVRSGQESIITPNENEKYIKLRTVSEIVSLGDDFKIMINAGESILPYEPYKQPQSLAVQTPNGLPGIPFSSGGNYTDENGQQWICDEIDFKRGKYVKRISRKEFTGNETVKATGYDNVFVIEIRDGNYEAPALCNMFVYALSGNNVAHTPAGFSVSAYSKGAIFNLDWIDTPRDAETAKAWFAQKYSEGNPVKVYYVLAQPIETDLSQEQLSAYANLHTNRPTTVVSATDGAGLEITYKTKKSLEVT